MNKYKQISVKHNYSPKEILKIDERQIFFGLDLALIDELNKNEMIKYSYDTVGDNTIVSATVLCKKIDKDKKV